MTQNPNDFLFGGGGKAAKFEQLGDKVTGSIEAVEMAPQTSLDTNEPLTWADGSPRMQLVVTLATDEHEDDDDDGIRRIYAKGGRFEVESGRGTSMKDAIADACRKAGMKSLDVGTKLTVAYTGVGKKKNRGHNAPKLYMAKVEKGEPRNSVDLDEMFGD